MGSTIKLTLEYDGTDYHGWERQPHLRTIQGELERALLHLTGEKIPVYGAGRTDAGVHALAQVAHFTTTVSRPPYVWIRSLNAHLPVDIAVQSAEEVPASFHARFSARGKTYAYYICQGGQRSALSRHRIWHLPGPLDVRAMRRAAKHLIGTQDFTSLCGKATERERHEVDLRQINIVAQGPQIEIWVHASHFLRYMVRNVVGLLVEVGRGRRSPDEIPAVLAARDRRQAGPTAPPHGLVLVTVAYGPETPRL